jgi:hypothetical protein
VLADVGHGHFDYSDEMIRFLALFIRKSAEQRLPAEMPLDRPAALKPVDARAGWLVEVWHKDALPSAPAAPFAQFKGDTNAAFWCFDQEMTKAAENFNPQRGKRPQLLGFIQDGQIVPQADTHSQVNLKFEPLADGVSFHLAATFLTAVDDGSKNLPRWTGLPAGSPLGHAAGGKISISRISGPVAKISGETFRIQYDRVNATPDRRNADVWLLASHPGDAKYKSAVQQALLKLPAFTQGAEQHIDFRPISDQKAGGKSLKLNATSDSGRPVYFFVREGPAEITGDVLRFTKIPPRAKFPVKVAVVAWQLGTAAEPKLQTAVPVTREFFLTN